MGDGLKTVDPEDVELSRLIGSIIFVFGTVITVSWMMGLPLLWFDGWPRRITRPNSGLGFLIAGLALRLIQKDRFGNSWKVPLVPLSVSNRRTVYLLSILLISLGGFGLIEELFRLNTGLNSFLILHKWYNEIDIAEARMSPITALEFVLTGMAFLLTDRTTRRGMIPSEAVSLTVLAISLDSITAFLYTNNSIPDFRTDSPIPLVSSVAFIALSTGMLASRKDRGLVSIWVSDSQGSTLVRRWLPISILMFILAGEIVDMMQDYGWVSPSISLSIFTITVITLTALVVLSSAVRLNESEKQLVHSNKLYALLSQSNQTMARVRERKQLLQSVCDIMTRYGDFRIACIKMLDGENGTPRIEACSGEGCDELVKSPEFSSEIMMNDAVIPQLNESGWFVMNDLYGAEVNDSVRTILLAAGLHSAVLLSLRAFNRPIGVVGVFSAEPDYFKEKEIDLLREVSLDLSFALEALERETHRENAESAMRASEERFRAIFEKAAVGIVLLTPTGIITKANPQFCDMTGYPDSELPGRSFIEITHPEDARNDASNLDRMIRGEISTYSVEKRYIRKGGSEVWAHLSSAIVRDRGGKPLNIISVVQDISERKRAEDLLRKSREQYQSFFEEDITADFIATIDGRILSCNPAFVRIFGFSSLDEAINTNANDLFLGAESRNEFFDLIRKSKKIENYEMTLRKRDMTEIHVIRSAFGIFDETGELVQTKNYLFDDTRRKALEKQVLQTQKMESLGTLAGGIAHDFNNILGIIMGHAALLKKRELPEERFARSLEAIDLATRRGAGLIRQLLTFARKEDKVVETLNVNEIINDLRKLFEETFPKVITISLELTEQLPLISGDPNQIHQALLNLCINARDAMVDRKDGKVPGGSLTISTAIVPGGLITDKFPKGSSDRYVRIVVADTGAGMDEITRGHLFEPFFTTKARGKGTGLGLATVYGIVEIHEGFIDAASQQGVGTSFTIYLPYQSPSPDDNLIAHSQDGNPEGGRETILVVEDEEMLIDFLKETLRRKGYNVIAASDGESAVSTFAGKFREIDLVLSDIGLPKLGGADMLNKLMSIKKDVKVVFASGFLDPDTKATISRAGARDFIQKPYTAVEVLAKVREVLDSSGAS